MNINKQTKILAIDFDGVICDGLAEYFETTKKTYQQIWKTNNQINLEDFRNQFYHLRPVIETGWEMPILLRALILQTPEKNILENWSQIVENIIKSDNLERKEIAVKLDTVRDNWIKTDLNNWLKLHRFYPNISQGIQKIINQNIKIYIVSTKEGRFIEKILKQENITLPKNQIIGKESQRSKQETLKIILQENREKPENMSFIEDRIEPLLKVHQESELQGVKLYLASWGYNTEKTRKKAQEIGYINLLNLDNFS